MKKSVEVVLLGRDRVQATIEFEGDESSPIVGVSLDASGCGEFLSALTAWKTDVMAIPTPSRQLTGSGDFDRKIPSGSDHASILIREVVLRLRGDFQLPYQEEELCHCRAVPREVVDRAIIGGCHSVAQVARATSAGTSCGTCKPDTESLIAYRKKAL